MLNFTTALLAIGVTLATTATIVYGVNYIIRDHNIHQYAKKLRQKQKSLRLSLRALEDEYSYVMIPKLGNIKLSLEHLNLQQIENNTNIMKPTSTSKDTILEHSGMSIEMTYKEAEDQLLRILERLDNVKVGDLEESIDYLDDYHDGVVGSLNSQVHEAVKSLRKKKRVLTGKVNDSISELDVLLLRLEE